MTERRAGGHKEQRRAPTARSVRAWLQRQGYGDVARMIDQVVDGWASGGKRTRRNWWDVLAGDSRGRPRTVDGVSFPVLAEAQVRQGLPIKGTATANAVFTPDPPRARLGARRAVADVDALPETRPFLKWAGGKRQIRREILALFPEKFGTYHEPFLGGGAVFFGLRPKAAILSDTNERLVRAYRGIKNSVDQVIGILETYRNEKRFFLALRKRPIDAGSDAEVAAWLIFLNKTGFNGLYRVNSRNEFNVPFAANKGARFCDEDNLRACSAALASADLECEDFTAVLARARSNDLVYFDPPYVPLSVTSSFTSYTSHGFGMNDQVRLRDVALELRNRGVFVLISNSSAAVVRDLYQAHCDLVPISALRLVNSDPKGRGRITELLIKPKERGRHVR